MQRGLRSNSQSALLAFPILLLRCAAAETPGSQCGPAGAGEDGSCLRRSVEEKTPTPCLKKYDEDHIQTAVEQHLSKAPKGNEIPHLLLLLGGSGAGKGTFLKHLLSQGVNLDDFVFHGLDEYLVYLPEFMQTINDKTAVYKDAADDCYGAGAIPLAKAAQNKIIANRQHAIYEETGKNLDRILQRVLPPFEAAGYRITAVLVDNDPAIAKARAVERFMMEGRYAPDDYIEGTFKNVPDNFKRLRETGRVKEAAYCDNSCLVGSSIEQAVTARQCLKCWREEADAPHGMDTAEPLIPVTALSDAPVVYLNPSAR